jgi:phosphoglycolate phosphatase
VDSKRSSPPIEVAAVLFDLDGTLVHTAPDLADAVAHMLAQQGRPPFHETTIEGWIGDGVKRLVKRALTGERDGEPDPLLFERAYADFVDFYGRHVSQRSRPFAGVRQGLEALRAAGVPLACVTSKMGVFTRALLHDLDLARFFELVVAGDTLERTKPDPLPLLYACSQLGVLPAQVVLVGDSENDARAARAAGVAFVAVSHGYTDGRDPRTLGADLLIDSLAELPPRLRLLPRGPRVGSSEEE